MEALIDNYSASAQSVSARSDKSVAFRYVVLPNPFYTSVTVSFGTELTLNQRIMRLLEEYSVLKDNWDEDDAKAPSSTAIKTAKYLTSLLEKHGQPIYHSAPGPNGEIMLDIRNKSKSKSVEIVLYQDRAILVSFPDHGKPHQSTFKSENLPEILEWLNQI